jgi:5-(carboxyamino)imidazole ribonucleotide mutase
MGSGGAAPEKHSEGLVKRKVGVLMGSPNDRDAVQPAADTLEKFGIEADVRVLSAHRDPAGVAAFATGARENGYAAIICAAGMAAHLGGAVAANTTLPVVGLPLSRSSLNGVDALYATVQMPPGIPVATVAIDGAKNAALLVVQMLAIDDAELAAQLEALRAEGRTGS